MTAFVIVCINNFVIELFVGDGNYKWNNTFIGFDGVTHGYARSIVYAAFDAVCMIYAVKSKSNSKTDRLIGFGNLKWNQSPTLTHNTSRSYIHLTILLK